MGLFFTVQVSPSTIIGCIFKDSMNETHLAQRREESFKRGMGKTGVNDLVLNWNWRRRWEVIVSRCVCACVYVHNPLRFCKYMYWGGYILYIYSLGIARLKQIKSVSLMQRSSRCLIS